METEGKFLNFVELGKTMQYAPLAWGDRRRCLIPWLGCTEFCIRLPVLLPKFFPSLPTCTMCYIGCLYLSGYSIISLCWSPVVSFVAPIHTFATSAGQCLLWQHVGCCVLLRGVSFWSFGPI